MKWPIFSVVLPLTLIAGEMAWRIRRAQHPPRRTIRLASGQRLEYVLWPPEAADSLRQRRVVVHLHGTQASGDDVNLMLGSADPPAVAALRPRVALIGLDRPGFGGSELCAGGRPLLPDLARVVEELVAALAVTSYAVVGFSAGGPVALAVAARAPPGLQRVVIVASPWFGGASPPRSELSAWASLPLHKVLSFALGPWLLGFFVTRPGLAEELGTSMARYYAQGAWPAAWEQFCLQHLPPGFELGAIRAPVEIFHGTADTTVLPEHAYKLSQLLPRSKLSLVPDADHITIARTAHVIFAAAVNW